MECTSVRIECDGPNCRSWFLVRPGESLVDARRELAQKGWRTAMQGTAVRDYCQAPACQTLAAGQAYLTPAEIDAASRMDEAQPPSSDRHWTVTRTWRVTASSVLEALQAATPGTHRESRATEIFPSQVIEDDLP